VKRILEGRPHRISFEKRWRTGRDPGRRENVVQRSPRHRKVVGRSRGRDRKGHRILRRVLVGGSHLGSSRAIAFHEAVVKAASAASSRGKAMTRKSRSPKETRRRSETSCGRGRGDRGVRGSIGQLAPWEDNAHARSSRTRSQDGASSPGARWQRVASGDPPKRSRVS